MANEDSQESTHRFPLLCPDCRKKTVRVRLSYSLENDCRFRLIVREGQPRLAVEWSAEIPADIEDELDLEALYCDSCGHEWSNTGQLLLAMIDHTLNRHKTD